ncbi:MAG: hypothetical protein FWE18_01300 [Alphaproteobacteria bacterium]|nr:hypothetical protein [Alphaproteobacteria bacterium]
MPYLYIICSIIILSINALYASILQDIKHNFFISVQESKVNNFMEGQEAAIKDEMAYSIGYLAAKDNFYLGVAFKKFAENRQAYNLNDTDSIIISKDSSWLLLVKYNVYEFESIKILFGVDLGYQSNNINLHYKARETVSTQEVQFNELASGEIITESLRNQCDAGFEGGALGDNIQEVHGQYVVVGSGVLCKSFYYVNKEITKDKNRNFMVSSLPVSLNFTTLYEISPNIDLGISLGLTMVEKLNVSYNDRFIDARMQNISSSYNLAFLINFKF